MAIQNFNFAKPAPRPIVPPKAPPKPVRPPKLVNPPKPITPPAPPKAPVEPPPMDLVGSLAVDRNIVPSGSRRLGGFL